MNNVPDGYPMPEDDATGLRVDVGFERGEVKIRFSKPTMSMSLPPSHVRSLAIALLQNAEMALAARTESLPPSRIP